MPDTGRVHNAKETRGEPLWRADGGKSQRQYQSSNRMGCFCTAVLCVKGRSVRAAEDGTGVLAPLLIGLASLWEPLS